jgi:hypothetical protein
VSGAVQVPICSAVIAAAVPDREYRRLLGLPRLRAGAESCAPQVWERAAAARHWYAAQGRPLVALRRIAIGSIDAGSIRVATGEALASLQLATRLQAARATELAVIVVSAGPEVVVEIDRRWREGRPDEAWCLDRFSTAVAERLLRDVAALRGVPRDTPQEYWLPHLSPGCADWDLADQHRLMGLLTADRDDAVIGPVGLLESGALSPRHSLLAVRGIARRRPAKRLAQACRACDLDPCHYRRRPSTGDRPPRTVPT